MGPKAPTCETLAGLGCVKEIAMPDYKNPKVRNLINSGAVSSFTALDFLDLALAAMDQASLRSAAYNRAYAAIEAVIAEETPEVETLPASES